MYTSGQVTVITPTYVRADTNRFTTWLIRHLMAYNAVPMMGTEFELRKQSICFSKSPQSLPFVKLIAEGLIAEIFAFAFTASMR